MDEKENLQQTLERLLKMGDSKIIQELIKKIQSKLDKLTNKIDKT